MLAVNWLPTPIVVRADRQRRAKAKRRAAVPTTVLPATRSAAGLPDLVPVADAVN